MTVTPLAVRRRNSVERKVLNMLRGELSDSVELAGTQRYESALRPAHAAYFGELRRITHRRGLVIRPAGSPYLDPDELLILSWLAKGQRVLADSSLPNDPSLGLAIARCAGMLGGMGLRLSPITLYGARLRALAE